LINTFFLYIKHFLYNILWSLFGYDNSLFDNRFMQHIAGGYAVSHIASLFFKEHYWVCSFFIAIFKEILDHFVFGCGGNEIKHFFDILSWSLGGISYYVIVILKRKKYNYS
jgi:hypothetical protein